jgi:hypothetical protein
MKSFSFLFFSALLFSSCGGGGHPEKPLPDSIPQAQAADDTVADAPIDETLYNKIIPFDLYKKRNISLDAPFSADSALTALFPGNYYPGEETAVIWSSPATRSRPFPGWFDEEPEIFPSKDSNATRIGTQLDFTDDNGKKCILISFASTGFEGDLMRTGRFSCACLGLALFREENNKWVLKNFSPALGCYGSFETLPAISLLKLGKNNFGCYLDNTNGGAGGPFYTDSYVFGLVKGEFSVLLCHIGSGRINAPSEWKSSFEGGKGNGEFCDLRCSTEGNYVSYESFKEVEDDTSNVPAAIKELIKTKEHFNFRIVTDFVFRDGAYIFKDEDAVTTPMKPEEWAKTPEK